MDEQQRILPVQLQTYKLQLQWSPPAILSLAFTDPKKEKTRVKYPLSFPSNFREKIKLIFPRKLKPKPSTSWFDDVQQLIYSLCSTMRSGLDLLFNQTITFSISDVDGRGPNSFFRVIKGKQIRESEIDRLGRL